MGNETKVKRCFTCGETKPLKDFHKNEFLADGLTLSCKECRKESKSEAIHTILDGDDIRDCTVTSKHLAAGYLVAQLYPPFNGKSQLPYAHYVWLMGNPAFRSIPKGYVIHHLDHDPLNNDISNLALMQKHHHASHHYKYLKIFPEVKLSEAEVLPGIVFRPTRKPRVIEREREYKEQGKVKTYFLKFSDANQNKKPIHLYRFKGEFLFSRQEAKKWADDMWENRNNTNWYLNNFGEKM